MTKNKYRLQREVHRTLEIAQTLMQRVVLLCSYAFVAKKGRPTNFLKLEFDKIAELKKHSILTEPVLIKFLYLVIYTIIAQDGSNLHVI